jgi:hypothetical protein
MKCLDETDGLTWNPRLVDAGVFGIPLMTGALAAIPPKK